MIIHQLSVDSASSTSIIVSVQIDFTASKSTQTIVLHISFLHRACAQLFTNLFLIHFQTKDSDTHAYAHSWSSHHSARNQPNNQLFARFFYNTSLYLLTSLFIDVTFLYWQVFFRQVRETNETTNLQARFFYNTVFY